MSRLSVPVAALVGLLSMVAGLAVGHLVGGVISPTASPFYAVGAAAIDLTPLQLKDFAVRTFGSYDKVALLSGMAGVIGLVGVVAGLLSRRSRTPGLALLVLLGVVGSLAVLTRPSVGALHVLAPFAASITSIGTFVGVHRLGRSSQVPARQGPEVRGVSRRRLLVGSVGIAAGAGIAAAGGQLLSGTGDIDASRTAVGRVVVQGARVTDPTGGGFLY